jgi:branched-chain amino acid transport system substrate-binding protein
MQMLSSRRVRTASVGILTLVLALTLVGGSTAGAAGTRAAAPSGTPLVIGWIGSESGGAIQTTSTQGRDGFEAWVKWMNANGGINGHPIKAYYANDKSDPAVALSEVKDLVENKKVIAIVGQSVSNVATWANYVKEQNVPVIGGTMIDATWFTNQMFYPVGGTVISNIWGQMKGAAEIGVKKVGVLLCTEVAACEAARPLFKSMAEANGLKEVYDAVASGTQPSYTAECLAAKNAGAEAMAAFVNTTVMSRDCARQNYHPKWINAEYGPTRETIKSAPELGKTVGSSGHWACMGPVQKGATKVFWTAMNKYHPEYMKGGKKYDQQAVVLCSDWDAGMAFKKAIENANVAATATATSEDVIKGLAMFKDETLDGFAPALNFNDGTQPNPQQLCIYTYKWQGTTMVPIPKDGSFTCQPQS